MVNTNIDVSKVKLLSFDVWNTLITPNLEFSRVRNEIIARHFGVPFDVAKRAYTETKRFLDTAAELTGFGTHCDNVYKLLQSHLKTSSKADVNLEQIRLEVNEAFAQNLPTLSDRVVELLIDLDHAGHPMVLLSNTNFIGGEQLMQHVFNPKLGEGFFTRTFFSDQWDLAKPSPHFFNLVTAVLLGTLSRNEPVPGSCAERILHIGDNEITDVKGARLRGMQSLLIRNPDDMVNQLVELFK